MRGMQQHYALGQWLRQRYDGWLPRHYSESDIYVRSTDVDRTLASAYSNLAALYAPTDGQIWNTNLLWQPIPVHTFPGELDYELGASIIGCPAYDRLMDDVVETPEISTFIGKNQKLIEYLANNTKSHPTSTFEQVENTLLVRDTLFIESLYNKTLPTWTQSIYPSAELDAISLLYYVLPAYNAQLAKFRVGYLLKELLDRSAAKVAGKLTPDRKVWVYSAHDINISTVLYALGLFDGEFVQYAAALLFEVHVKKDNQAYLSIAYRRNAGDHHAETLIIPGCGYQCPLSRMYELYSDILPTEDFATACRIDLE